MTPGPSDEAPPPMKRNKTGTNLDTLAVSEAEPWTVVLALVVEHVVRRVLLTLDQQSNTISTS